jgi:hypothetical protein
MAMKKFDDTNGKGTRNHLACSEVPQPTAPQRNPSFHYKFSETNCENFIPYVLPCFFFTATNTGRLSSIYSSCQYSHIACLFKKAEQLILYVKEKKSYSQEQLLCFIAVLRQA